MRQLLSKIAHRINNDLGVNPEHILVYRRLPHDEVTNLDLSSGVVIDLLPAAQLESLRQVGPIELDLLKRRITQGDQCYVAHLNGRLAHYSWVQHHGYHNILQAGIDYAVSDNSLWIYDCSTAAWARGRRIYPSVLNCIVQDYFRRGFVAAFIYTSPSNVASQHGILKAGFKLCCTLSSLRVGHKYFGRPGNLVLLRSAYA